MTGLKFTVATVFFWVHPIFISNAPAHVWLCDKYALNPAAAISCTLLVGREATGGSFTSIDGSLWAFSRFLRGRGEPAWARRHACARVSCFCMCKPASKSSLMTRRKNQCKEACRQTIELFEGESHFPEQFPQTARLQMNGLCPNPVATLLRQSWPPFIIILRPQSKVCALGLIGVGALCVEQKTGKVWGDCVFLHTLKTFVCAHMCTHNTPWTVVHR